MPDASGNFKGIAVPADAWERIFGRPEVVEPCAAPRCPGRHECDRGFGPGQPCWVTPAMARDLLG